MKPKQYVPIIAAMSDVTPQEFCVWLKLHMLPSSDLEKGIAYLATLCGYSQQRFQEILNKLWSKGYVVVHKKGPPGPTLVTVEKYASLPLNHTILVAPIQPPIEQ